MAPPYTRIANDCDTLGKESRRWYGPSTTALRAYARMIKDES